MSFVKTWMDLEGIMLSEIRQAKTNTVTSHLHVEPKTNKQQQQQQKLIYREQMGGCQR